MWPLPEGAEGIRNMLASLGLRWWQYTIVKDLHEHSIAAEVTGSIKTFLIPGFSYVHQMLLFASDYAENCFPSNLRLLWQLLRLKGMSLKTLEYIHLRFYYLPPPNDHLCSIFLNLYLAASVLDF